MEIPSDSHMEAYLKHLGIRTGKNNIKSEYLRSIYRVLPRKKALNMSLKQARQQTSIQPGNKSGINLCNNSSSNNSSSINSSSINSSSNSITSQ